MPSYSLLATRISGKRLSTFVVAATVALSSVGLRADIIPSESRKPAPRWKLPCLTGGSKQLSDYKGKVLLLNFWATWCAPCKQEIPCHDRAGKALADSIDAATIARNDVFGPFDVRGRTEHTLK
jgi:thiol-disulfide isomerase/thioredoxin